MRCITYWVQKPLQAAAAMAIDPEVPLFGVWRLGRIGRDISGTNNNKQEHNHSTLMEYSIFQF